MTRFLLIAAAAVAFTGCGKRAHPLTGAVTYDGKPVPFGQMSIVPDETKGNAAPAILLDFKDGRYETPGTRGQYGGAYKITITGFDGVPPKPQYPGEQVDQRGSPLFEDHKVFMDLPASAATYDINVPAQPARKKL